MSSIISSRHRHTRRAAFLVLMCAVFMLTGCNDRLQDLRQYVNQVKARKGAHVEPLPQVKPFETFTYDDQNLRSPFIPQLQSFATLGAGAGGGSGVHPDFNRAREYLEQFPLDGLKMMGTITVNGIMYALIRDGDGVVHRVTAGNYMGQNFGKIVKITQAGLTLREIIPDGQGGWIERMTTVQLGG